MNHDVPHPATATRSPGAGSSPATSAASAAACRQHAGCEATSRLRAGAHRFCHRVSRVLPISQVPASPVAATDRTK